MVKMIYKPILLLLCLAVMSGCMFMGDRKVHVSGTVTDEAGRPLQGATVRFLANVEETTNAKGHFHFGGVFPGGHLPLKVIMAGFKPYQGSRKFDYYDVTICLAKETAQSESKGNWKVLKKDDLQDYGRDKE